MQSATYTDKMMGVSGRKWLLWCLFFNVMVYV